MTINTPRSFQFIALLVISLLLLLIFSCKKDPIGPIIVDFPLVTETIGPDGGTVGTEVVSIDIPAGAFNADNIINVYAETDDGAFGDNTVSSSYKISGLPEDYYKSIKISMKYTGELEGESYLGVGRQRYNYSTEDSSIIYKLYTVADSSGYLVGEISPVSSNGLGKRKLNDIDNLDIVIKIISSYVTYNSTKFTIYYPLFAVDVVPIVEEILNDAHSIIYEGLKIPEKYFKKIVTLKYQSNPVESASWNRAEMDINISLQHLLSNQLNDIKVGAVQSLFYPTSVEVHNNWAYQAIHSWFEDLISDVPNYKYPTDFLENIMASFSGMNNGNTESTYRKHGIGMSAVIKYFKQINPKGYEGVGNVYKHLNGGSYQPADGLVDNLESSTVEWWPNYFHNFINGDLFELPINHFLDNVSAEWDINTIEDTLKEFSSSDVGSYPDLSAKMFKINLNHSNFDSTHSIQFSLKGTTVFEHGFALLVYSIKEGGTSEYLNTVRGKDFTISNLKQYLDTGVKQILVVLVNSNIDDPFNYAGTTDIDLMVKVESRPDLSKYKKCEVTIKVFTKVHYEYYGSPPDTTISTHYRISSIFPVIGSFTGNTFTGAYNHLSDSGDYTWAGTMTATVNNNATAVTDIKWDGTDSSSNGSHTEKGFTATNTTIPLIPTNPSWNILKFGRFSHNTVDVLEGITAVYYDNYHYSSGSLLYRSWFNEFSNGDRSEMEITFKE